VNRPDGSAQRGDDLGRSLVVRIPGGAAQATGTALTARLAGYAGDIAAATRGHWTSPIGA